MTGICMRDVTHFLSSDNILPVNIFNLYERHNIVKEYKQVISKKKTIGTSRKKKENH